MAEMKKIAVLGNCQAQLIETLFCAGSDKLSIFPMSPVFQMTSDMQPEVENRLAQADIIFSQRVDPNYHMDWLRPSVLRAKFGKKVIIWPNIYFDGYFPDVQYIYLNHWGKLKSPLDDYHFASIVNCFNEGFGAKETSNFFESQIFTEDTFAESLDRLRSREADVDVPISDFVAMSATSRRMFYTPNHPYSFVLVEMCRRLSSAAGILYDANQANKSAARLDRIYIPTHCGIRKKLNLKFDRVPLFRGLEVKSVGPAHVELGRARSFDLRELVDSFFMIYDIALKKAS